jgi:hypothetical protein
MREEIIRIKLKDIRDSLEKVKTHLPKTLEEFLDSGLKMEYIKELSP